jgi:hypothetical protein
MTLLSFGIYLVPVLCGSLLAHLLWPDKRGMALLLKLALGVGAGLGISSIVYFLSLLIAPGRINIPVVLGALLVFLSVITFVRERGRPWDRPALPTFSRLQWALLLVTISALIFSGLIFINLTIARPQGSFDAWGIWNRTARFIYRDPENWRATFSPDLFWLMHADYPLLIPLNVAWGWDAAGGETSRVPSMQSALFLFATIGLMFTSIGRLRSVGQASLASLVLVGAPIFFFTGYGQIADVPVAFYILAASVLIYFYFVFKQPGLLALAGFMAGLAAWTKNEGLLFVAVSPPVLILAGRGERFRPLLVYLAGLAIPLAVVVYFKIALAPANDLFGSGDANLLAKIMDPFRYITILKELQGNLLAFAGWPFSIFIQLAIYAWIVRLHPTIPSVRGVYAVAALIILQLLGYCAVYLLTPHDLVRHLTTSLSRLILQLYPSSIFLFFSLISEPEEILQPLDDMRLKWRNR